MKRVYLGNTELTTIATRDSAGGGGGDDTKKWVDYFNGNLTEFTVPEGVTNINSITFFSCTGLTSLTLPSSVTSIERIKTMGMPDSESNPFGTLKTMTVKATTPPSIGYNEWDCPIPTTISRIDVPKFSVNIYKAFDGWNSFADKIHGLPQNETVVTYNDGTTKKFDIKGELTKDNIENITAATKVVIGDDVTIIGDSAFYECSSLTCITIQNSVTSINNSAFVGCQSLTVVTIPNSVTNIGNSAFYNCSSLTGVIIENSTSKLAYNTNSFDSISSTAKVYVPSNLLSDYQADTNYTNAFKGGIYSIETSMKVTYADNTEKIFTDLIAIKSDTDSNKKNAKNIVIYDTVLSINNSAFYECSSLTGITLPNSVTNIGNSAFYNCSSLTGITIPDSVTSIGNEAFEGCSSLSSITIPDSVTSIGNFAFENCSSLSSITIPDSVTSIGNSAFYSCSGLTSIIIPESVTSIDRQAFVQCSSLTNITIPNSVTSIGDSAFCNCKKLESVTIKNSTSKLTYINWSFYDISPTAKLFVPSNLLADYQADSNWVNAFKGGIFEIDTTSFDFGDIPHFDIG